MSSGKPSPGRLGLLLVVLLLSLFAFEYHRRACRAPITYRIGSVDERFGMSRESFANVVDRAAGRWRAATQRELFKVADAGGMEINLVYDHRQAAIDRMKALGLRVGRSRGECEILLTQFQSMKVAYEAKGQELLTEAQSYHDDVKAFNATVARPLEPQEIAQIQAQKRHLDNWQQNLEIKQMEHHERGQELKALADLVNEMAEVHNLQVRDYQTTGDALGAEFSQGLYRFQKGRESIHIYHFETEDSLERVLVHELGHALGIEHLPNSKAVMHRLMTTDDPTLNSDDIQAAQKVKCLKR